MRCDYFSSRRLERIMPEVPLSLSEYGSRLLSKRQGVRILVNTPVQSISPGQVHLKDRTIESETIILSSGILPSPIIAHLPLPKDAKGNLQVEATMRCKERPEIWAIGDCASIPDMHGKPYPKLAQFAMRQAKTLADNLYATLDGKPLVPFEFKMLGLMAALGHNKGLATAFGIRIRGFLAWWLRRTYYLMVMPRWSQRVRIVADWTIALFFRPEISKVDLGREQVCAHAPTDSRRQVDGALMSSEKYENLIIGSGEGGKFIAWHLAKLGQKTAVVERKWIGGSCPNINCLPSKNEIWSAKVADLFHHAQKFGVVVGSVAVDMAGVLKRKRAMVDGLVAMHLEKYKTSGAELIMGEAKFTGLNTVEVQLNDGGTRPLGAQRVFLNLGTNATIPPTPGLSDSKPLTHIQMLELDRLPEHLIVIGGGYVGLEFAQAYRRFGSRVTIIQRGPQILADKDPDIAAAVLKFITGEGIDVITSADIVSVTGRSGIEVQIIVRAAGADKTIAGSDILVAAGRTPNTSGIGLESAGVELDAQGFIKVNHRLEATAPNVWAIGECAGSPQFTHVSYDDYRVIRDNLAGGNRSTRDRLIPSCLFTDPPVAQIGLSEAEANASVLRCA